MSFRALAMVALLAQTACAKQVDVRNARDAGTNDAGTDASLGDAGPSDAGADASLGDAGP